MSISLVKKSLQIIESSNFKGNRTPKADSSNSNAFKKVRGEKSKVRKSASKNTSIIKAFQKLQKELRENKSNDKTEENLKKLAALSKHSKVDDKKAFEFFKRATKSDEVKVEKVKTQTSIFTEEDFARFEREYVYE